MCVCARVCVCMSVYECVCMGVCVCARWVPHLVFVDHGVEEITRGREGCEALYVRDTHIPTHRHTDTQTRIDTRRRHRRGSGRRTF